MKKNKYIVYYPNDYTLLGREYFNFEKGKIIGYHNPRLALHFDTEKEAGEFQKKINLGTKITTDEVEYKRFDKTSYKYRTLEPINDTYNIQYDKNKQSKYDVLKWWLTVQRLPESTISHKVYSSYPSLYSLFSYLWQKQTYNTLDYKSFYYTVEIKTSKSGIYEEFVKEFDLVKDEVTYLDDDKYKIFPIFEHNLHEGGVSYTLRYKTLQDCIISSGRSELTKGSLKECFEYMKRDLWYE